MPELCPAALLPLQGAQGKLYKAQGLITALLVNRGKCLLSEHLKHMVPPYLQGLRSKASGET